MPGRDRHPHAADERSNTDLRHRRRCGHRRHARNHEARLPPVGPARPSGYPAKDSTIPRSAENHLLELLPRRSRLRLLALSEPVHLVLGAIVGDPGDPARHVYFPTGSFISLVARIEGEPWLETGMIGREGLLGAQLALGIDATPMRALVQGAGPARRVATAIFRRELARTPALRRVVNRYLYVLISQLATSAACTRFHHVGPRLARWLLMSHDRAEASGFHLTHEFLARMLGVRRVGITGAASDLQRRGLIRYHRGDITVLDRAGLEGAACSCYAAGNLIYERYLR